MANYMAEVAKMLGVEIGEEFEIGNNGKVIVKLTENGLKIVTALGKLIDNAEHVCLAQILTGKYEIRRLPWKPSADECYYSVTEEGLIGQNVCVWDFIDISLYRLGNCYHTKEEAEANRDKWISFYESDEVLEV